MSGGIFRQKLYLKMGRTEKKIDGDASAVLAIVGQIDFAPRADLKLRLRIATYSVMRRSLSFF
jgi:hypothetical protein